MKAIRKRALTLCETKPKKKRLSKFFNRLTGKKNEIESLIAEMKREKTNSSEPTKATSSDFLTHALLGATPLPPVLVNIIKDFHCNPFQNYVSQFNIFEENSRCDWLFTDNERLFHPTNSRQLGIRMCDLNGTFINRYFGRPMTSMWITEWSPRGMDQIGNRIYLMHERTMEVNEYPSNKPLYQWELPEVRNVTHAESSSQCLKIDPFSNVERVFYTLQYQYQVFSCQENGTGLRKYGEEKRRGFFNPNAFSNPYGIALDSKYLFVTDTDSDRVFVLSKTSKKLIRYIGAPFSLGMSRIAHTPGVLYEPRNILLHREYLYINDKYGIHIFNKIGSYINSLSKIRPSVDGYRVGGMCVIKNKLYVSRDVPDNGRRNCWNHIQVFE